MHSVVALAFLGLLLFAATATGEEYAPGFGPNPQLPEPEHSLVPTVNIAPAKSWPAGATPTAAGGLQVTAFAKDLDHPRWLYVLPNGDVLVAETDAPPRPEEGNGLKAWFMSFFQKRAGSTRTASPNRITLLRDGDGDGIAEIKRPFLTGLNSPFGMALVGDALYVANTDALMRFHYDGETVSPTGEKVADLPGGPIDHHWTKNVIASEDGKKLYVTVGSNSNVGENGLDKEESRAAILEIDPATGNSRIFASGLRNPNGLGWQPQSKQLWTVVNERDELGNDLVPDYLTSVKDGGFYGWPFSYFGQHVDTRVKEQRPDLVATALVPDYGLGAHTASLGLAFYDGKLLPEHFLGGAFVGQHGSWNRDPRAGYKVIFVPFKDGEPSGPPEDILTGFVDADGNARGRPVGVAVGKTGALLVADDVGNAIWRVAPALPKQALVQPVR
jgi:glucose/arabinose dehydrogenase